MNPKTFCRILSAFWAGIALVGWASTAAPARASVDVPPAIKMGDSTYSITRVAKNGFHRDVDALKAQAMEDATRFCVARGKQLKVVNMTSEKPWVALGYCKATIVFKALDAGDPELAGWPAPVAGNVRPVSSAPSQQPAPVTGGVEPVASAPSQQPAPPTAREEPLTTDDLYKALMQLEDLRKKGILTEDEFQSEKQKVLRRSR